MTPKRKPEPPDDEVFGDEGAGPTEEDLAAAEAEEATMDIEGMGPDEDDEEAG